MFGHVTIKDDRGVVLPLFDERGVSPRGDDGVARAAAKKGDRVTGNLTLVQVGLVIGIVGLPWALALTLQWAGISNVMMSHRGGSLVLLVATCLIVMVVARELRRRATRKGIREALLKARRCASCGYSLETLGVEGDGCVVCAECGGAWKRG